MVLLNERVTQMMRKSMGGEVDLWDDCGSESGCERRRGGYLVLHLPYRKWCQTLGCHWCYNTKKNSEFILDEGSSHANQSRT